MKPSKEDQSIHRSGPAKQNNKKHKTGRHKSKGTLEILKKGNYLKHRYIKKLQYL